MKIRLNTEAQAYLVILAGIAVVVWIGMGWRSGLLVIVSAVITFLATALAAEDHITELTQDLGEADDQLDEYDQLKAIVGALQQAQRHTLSEDYAIEALRAWTS